MPAFVVPEEHSGERLDVALAAMLEDTSRSAVQKLIRDGAALLNGRPARPKDAVDTGDIVTLEALVPQVLPSAAPEDIPLDVVYEDDMLLVVNKPQGMTTHPAPGSPSGTLVNALMGRGIALSDEGGDLRPGIVHRLDKDTSGLLVVAKTTQAHHFLARQLANRTLSRRYLAIVWGVPRWNHARVDAPIGRHATNRLKMSVVTPPQGRPAVTELDVLEPLGPMALLRARLQSGRTHQIRVHSSYAGHPVVADPLYGGERPGQVRLLPPGVAAAMSALPGQALHAARLAFVHPGTNETMAFAVPPPGPFMRMLEALESRYTAETILSSTEIAEQP